MDAISIQNMAQLDGMQQNGGTPRTVEQLLHSDNPKSWDTSSVVGRVDDPEDEYLHHGKKLSVIAKVKEKAKKWRQSLAKKKSGHDGNTTPSWGVALEDYEVEEEPENLGSQAYDSQRATRNTRHYRAEPLITDKRLFSSDVQTHIDNLASQKLPTLKMNRTVPALGKSHSDHQGENTPLSGINEAPRALSLGNRLREAHPGPSKFMLDTLTDQSNSNEQKEKLPRSEVKFQVMPTDTETTKEKEEQSGIGKGTNQVVIEKSAAIEEKEECSSPKKDDEEEGERLHSSMKKETETETEDAESKNATEEQEQQSPTTKKTITEAVSEKLAPAYATVSEATYKITSKIQGLYIGNLHGTGEEREWHKGISVKEYFKNKLEPGEDEKALSQVISEVISPKRSPTDKGVVEKVRAAMSLLLQSEEPSSSSSKKRSSSQIPLSTNAHEVEEENKERNLQAT